MARLEVGGATKATKEGLEAPSLVAVDLGAVRRRTASDRKPKASQAGGAARETPCLKRRRRHGADAKLVSVNEVSLKTRLDAN